MRSPGRLLALCLAAFACGKGTPADECQHNFDCATGEACVSGKCQAQPCGGCQPDEACGGDGKCVAAQGQACVDHTCPAAYPCNSGGVCARPCTLNADCDSGFLCNSKLKSCTQCEFDTQCASKKDTPVCNADTGFCAACNTDFNCKQLVGAGHYCDAHVCKPGCKTNDDCDGNSGETCDTSTSAGKCVQCHTNTDCQNAFGASAGACDNTGHCVQCWGADQASANFFCSAGSPECDLGHKTCVACLPANNASGADCGTPVNGSMDPHSAQTCNPDTYRCIPGCQVDAQCGCPHSAPGGGESDCLDPDGVHHRNPDQEHCDPNRTTMVGFSGATRGACVQCTDNSHCSYKIGQPGFTGARCANDSCVAGCDTDADCYGNRQPVAGGKYCYHAAAGQPGICADCHCDASHVAGTGVDGYYCETDPVCANAGRVCDLQSLKCRAKRQGEQCLNSNECGDLTDSSTSCLAPRSLCVYSSHDGAGTGGTTYCAADHSSFGRCGMPCDDFQNNFCTGTTPCPAGSHCRQASDGSGQPGAICVASTCSF